MKEKALQLLGYTLAYVVSALYVILPVAYYAISVAHAGPNVDYYEDAEGLTGEELKAALHTIIDGHTALPYTKRGNDNLYDGKDLDVWEALRYTDSACHDDQPKCGYVWMLYLPEYRHMSDRNTGLGRPENWDREHVWPKSRGFEDDDQDGYTDLHHLRPADRNINGAHSNYGYDEGGEPVMDTIADGTKLDSGARRDKDGQSFEPTDQAKGQIARMIFYMAVRYEIGDDAEPEEMPDLQLRDENAKVKEPWIGDLCTLLQWNTDFPTDEFERRRNDRVEEIQGNRNPFIDNPGWANEIWSDECQ